MFVVTYDTYTSHKTYKEHLERWLYDSRWKNEIEKIGKSEKIWTKFETEKYAEAGFEFEPATCKNKTFWEYWPEQRRRASFGVRQPA